MVHSDANENVGAGVGVDELGAAVGTAVGTAVGVNEGEWVPVKVIVGASEGVEVGASEGVEVGASEGVEVGASEGVEVGASEGVEVGASEGVEVGAELGGDCVSVLSNCNNHPILIPQSNSEPDRSSVAKSLNPPLAAL